MTPRWVKEFRVRIQCLEDDQDLTFKTGKNDFAKGWNRCIELHMDCVLKQLMHTTIFQFCVR